MKIVEITCKNCKAEYETLESIPKSAITCSACGSKEIDYKVTKREFNGCGGGCASCGSCE